MLKISNNERRETHKTKAAKPENVPHFDEALLHEYFARNTLA